MSEELLPSIKQLLNLESALVQRAVDPVEAAVDKLNQGMRALEAERQAHTDAVLQRRTRVDVTTAICTARIKTGVWSKSEIPSCVALADKIIAACNGPVREVAGDESEAEEVEEVADDGHE
ncbi:MAG: hypothetical protein ACOY3P_26205 [Planctomycetota bacterium]